MLVFHISPTRPIPVTFCFRIVKGQQRVSAPKSVVRLETTRFGLVIRWQGCFIGECAHRFNYQEYLDSAESDRGPSLNLNRVDDFAGSCRKKDFRTGTIICSILATEAYEKEDDEMQVCCERLRYAEAGQRNKRRDLHSRSVFSSIIATSHSVSLGMSHGRKSRKRIKVGAFTHLNLSVNESRSGRGKSGRICDLGNFHRHEFLLCKVVDAPK